MQQQIGLLMSEKGDFHHVYDRSGEPSRDGENYCQPKETRVKEAKALSKGVRVEGTM